MAHLAALAALALSACSHSEAPAPRTPAPATAPATAPLTPAATAPAPLTHRGELDHLLAQHAVALTGALEQRTSLYWGGPVDVLDLGDAVVAVRLPYALPETHATADVERAQALEARVAELRGQQVTVEGSLRLATATEPRVTEEAGGDVMSPMVDVALAVVASGVEPVGGAASGAKSSARAASSAHDLSQVLRSAPVQARGTLHRATAADGQPRFALRLGDDTLLDARIVVEAAPEAAALVGQPVTLDGRVALSEDSPLTFTHPTLGEQSWPVGFTVEVRALSAAPAPSR